jgi:hypothetical protein
MELSMNRQIAIALVVVASVSAILYGNAQSTAAVGELTVAVVDRALDTPMLGVRVRVNRAGADKASGITGPKGTVTFQGLELGEVRVLSEREGYVRKPESTDTTVRVGANILRVTLLAESGDGDYFRRAGLSIETEGARLPSEKREAFYQAEWDRAKLLKSESQIPFVLEMKKGREYLSKDGTYQNLVKAGKVIGGVDR